MSASEGEEDGSDAIIASLQLQPHPEGGWYRETWRDKPADGSRGSGTAIYYLLRAGERSHWHRVDAVEIWHWYAGGALTLSVSEDGKVSSHTQLGPSFALGHKPQLIVPKGAWQSAETRSRWTLVGCTVSPAFDFAGFEMAKPGWSPA